MKDGECTYRSKSIFRNTTASRLKYLFSRSCSDMPRLFLGLLLTPIPPETDVRLVMEACGWCLVLELSLDMEGIWAI